MAPSPIVSLNLLAQVSTATAFLPAVAGLWARRSPREPAGMAAIGWLGVALIGLVHHVSFSLVRSALPTLLIASIGTALYVPLLLPHTLAWIGRDAKRWLWPVMAVWLVGSGALLVVLGPGREYRTVVSPLVAIVMWIPTALALGACTRRAPADPTGQDWLWILTGQLVYFTVDIFRKPVTEALVARHWDVMVGVFYGMILLYSVCYALVARGLLLGPETDAARPSLRSLVARQRAAG